MSQTSGARVRPKSTANGSAGTVQTRTVRVKLRDLRLLEKNARYMKDAQFQQLVENLRADGCLTSAPLIYDGDVLSGNHRVQAAIEAGIEEADAIEITSTLTRKQRTAIQLSHNAIVGQDDPSMLHDLYAGLDLSAKTYSGLTDDDFKGLLEIDTAGLSVGAVTYDELVFLFLPEDEAVFLEALAKVESVKKRPRRLAANYKDFDRIFEAIIAVKEKHNIHNSAVALRVMADLALERLAQEGGADVAV